MTTTLTTTELQTLRNIQAAIEGIIKAHSEPDTPALVPQPASKQSVTQDVQKLQSLWEDKTGQTPVAAWLFDWLYTYNVSEVRRAIELMAERHAKSKMNLRHMENYVAMALRGFAPKVVAKEKPTAIPMEAPVETITI